MRQSAVHFACCVVLGFSFAAAEPVFHNAESLRSDLELVRPKTAFASESLAQRSQPEKTTHEAKMVLLGMLWFYQVFLSSQDGDHCGFTLSCSHFGQEALKQYGIIEGTLMTSDRLQRCNGFGRDYYPIDPVSDKAIDPVSADALWP